MSSDLTALLTNARWMPAEERATVAESWAAERPSGTLLLVTCHRVELYGSSSALGDLARDAPSGVHQHHDHGIAEHVVRVAVGRDSAVVAEDQILHQLRRAAHDARRGVALPVALDRLLDAALRAGRMARSWLPARRPSLVDLAIARAVAGGDVSGRKVLVVGTGEMGRSAAANLIARGAQVSVTSRTDDSARLAASRFGVGHVAFDPGDEAITDLAGVVVGLKGRWAISDATRAALKAGSAWIVDVSAPPALDAKLADALRGRLVTIDDLARGGDEQPSTKLLGRLDTLIAETVAEFERWTATETRREAADALASRAQAVRSAELERLWRRMPSLSDAQRAEVERAFDHATERLLREPLEQLGRDGDARQVDAVRELFRL